METRSAIRDAIEASIVEGRIVQIEANDAALAAALHAELVGECDDYVAVDDECTEYWGDGAEPGDDWRIHVYVQS